MISLDKKKQPHVPERTCIGCSGKFAKGTLLRFVLVSDVHIEIDPRHIKPGRGTYVCKKKSCADRVVKQKRLHRAFRCKVGEDIYEQFMKAMQSYE
ncbi:MAG: YlxR family protein [Deferribacteres bacterium]|nr:YlxR family protein [candidate division KSB1 bacterium]MCB9501729.1 YlxR family protein [Deferribacteres bacterium]